MATGQVSPVPPVVPPDVAAPPVPPALERAPHGRARGRGPRGSALGRWLVRLLLVGVSALFLYPLVWLVAASLKTRAQVLDGSLWPAPFAWENYARVWTELPLAAWVGNSVAIALASAVLVSVSSSLVAFGFAAFRFPGRRVLFALVLGTMMLPGAVTLVPSYLIWAHLGLLGTTAPLWAPALFGSAFYIFLQRQFLLGLPRELFDAARVDGASWWAVFWRIVMPLSLPSTIIIFLFEFQSSWNNLQGALVYLRAGDVSGFTAPLGIAFAMTSYSPTAGGQGDYQYVMVASLVVTLPMLVLFAVGQRYFVEGIATTGRTG